MTRVNMSSGFATSKTRTGLLSGYADWSVSLLFAYGINRFSNGMAQTQKRTNNDDGINNRGTALERSVVSKLLGKFAFYLSI